MAIVAQVPATRVVQGPSLLKSLLDLVTTGKMGVPVSYTTFMIVVTVRADSDTQVRSGSEVQWIVSHRYSAFRNLHRRLSTKFATLPALPPPRPLLNRDPILVEERRACLHQYLVGLLAQRAVICSEEIQHFLELQEHGVSLRDPSKLMATTVLTDQVFSIRSLLYADDIVVTACEDTAVFNRLDSLLTNTRLPWEKQGAIVPIGCVNVWSHRERAEWIVSTSAYFPSAVTAVAYDRRHRQVFAALSCGLVHAYNLNSLYTQLADARVWTAHRKRIVQAQHLDQQRILITCSLDSTIAMTDTHSSLLVARSLLGQPVLAFQVTSDERWCIAGTSAASLYVIDLSERQFRVVRQISDQVKGPVTSLLFCPEQRALFTARDRVCTIYSLSTTELATAAVRTVAELQEGPTSAISQIVFAPSTSQILTAHHNGCIAVWDTTGPGSIRYVVRAHEAEITTLQWVGDDRLISASLDGCVKFWNLPSNGSRRTESASIAKMVQRSQPQLRTPPPSAPVSRRSSSVSISSSRASSPESVEMT